MEGFFNYFIICGLFLILLYLNKNKVGDILSPPQLYAIYWFVQILVIVPVLRIMGWYYEGLYWIFGSALIFSLVFIFVKANPIDMSEKDYTTPNNLNVIKNVIIVTFIGALSYIVNLLILYDISLLDAITDIGRISSELYILRNTGGEKISVISRISLILLYAYPLLLGYYHHILQKKIYIIAGGILILYASILQGTKSVFITSSILFFSGWLVSRIENRKRIEYREVKKILFSIIAVILFSVVGLIVKAYGKTSLYYAICHAYVSFLSYAFGHLFAFDHWFYNYSSTALTGGQYTFFGIFNALGIAHRNDGIFQDFVDGGWGNVAFYIHTNVYTAFRPIIMDFSVWGGLVFVALVATITGIAYKKVVESKETKPFCITILVAFYSFLLWSFVTSIFAYASYICAFVYFYLCQKLVIWKSRS